MSAEDLKEQIDRAVGEAIGRGVDADEIVDWLDDARGRVEGSREYLEGAADA